MDSGSRCLVFVDVIGQRCLVEPPLGRPAQIPMHACVLTGRHAALSPRYLSLPALPPAAAVEHYPSIPVDFSHGLGIENDPRVSEWKLAGPCSLIYPSFLQRGDPGT